MPSFFHTLQQLERNGASPLEQWRALLSQNHFLHELEFKPQHLVHFDPSWEKKLSLLKAFFQLNHGLETDWKSEEVRSRLSTLIQDVTHNNHQLAETLYRSDLLNPHLLERISRRPPMWLDAVAVYENHSVQYRLYNTFLYLLHPHLSTGQLFRLTHPFTVGRNLIHNLFLDEEGTEEDYSNGALYFTLYRNSEEVCWFLQKNGNRVELLLNKIPVDTEKLKDGDQIQCNGSHFLFLNF
jgi:hypothetical protein